MIIGASYRKQLDDVKNMTDRFMEKHMALTEAVLFATPKPLSMQELAKLTKLSEERLGQIIPLLRIRYQDGQHGIALGEAGGYRLIVKSEFVAKVSGLAKAELSRGLLKVLSMIAYHQPAKQSDIVKVIGNRTYEYVKQLESMGFIRFERKSRTKLLMTTQHFEDYFSTSKDEMKKAAEKVLSEQKQQEAQKPEGTQEKADNSDQNAEKQ